MNARQGQVLVAVGLGLVVALGVVVALGAAGEGTDAQEAGAVAEGLVGHWQFDEISGTIAVDSSGLGNDGTLTNGPVYTTTTPPLSVLNPYALNLDGTDDYVEIANEANFDLNELSIALWFQVDSFTREWQALVTKGDSAWRLQRCSDTDVLCFDTTGLADGGLEGTTDVNDGQWHHVAAVFDGSTKYLYVDGELDVESYTPGQIALNDYPVYIGENAQETGRYFDGRVDDVRIYGRSLSAEEVAALARPVLYVDADAAGASTGLSWTDAFTEVQSALALAGPGAEIWVAEGVYYPDYDPDLEAHTGWVSATFALTNGMALYGGFDPESEVVAPEQRDPAAYVTTLSGDLDRNDAADLNGVVTTTENITGTNAWTVVIASGVDGTAVLDGFTVTAGNANGTPDDCAFDEPCQNGGGMYVESGSPTLTGVTFSGSWGNWSGGGMCTMNGSPTLTDVTFRGNLAITGGGMYNGDGSSSTLINAVFMGNRAIYYGGGMYNWGSSSPTLVDVAFSGNSAVVYYGGGMDNWDSSSPTLVNVTFSGNSAGSSGGGMSNRESSNPTLSNCILWGNTDSGSSEEKAQITNLSSVVTVTYSLVGGGVYTGSGNISADPLFVNAAGGDLRLRPGSPAIDAGDNAAVPAGITTDLGGNPRFVDVPSVPDTGSGIPPIVDMGAYEAPPPVIYVDRDAGGENTGLSWADAFRDLQAALAWAAEGVEIWVGEGVYMPTRRTEPTDARTVTFQLVDGVALYGGFDPGSGAETMEERDPAAYVTTLSGDLDGNDAAGPNGVVTEADGIEGDNAYHVTTGSGVDETAVLDGFVITGGDAGADLPHNRGGGMANEGASPTLRDVTFSGNRAADRGGGMHNYSSSPTLTDVTFRGNSARYGGGMYNRAGSNPTLTGVAFAGNRADSRGGGMFSRDSSPTLTDVSFEDNFAIEMGGGMTSRDGNPVLTRVTFTGNTAEHTYGGGMWNRGGSPSLTNVAFSGNSAGERGGGMYNYESSPTLVGVSLGSNSAGSGGGMFNEGSSPTLANCILWGNTDSGSSEEKAQITNLSSVVTVTYSLVGGGVYTGSGNISAAPLFVDADGGDLRLRPGSPAIDAGDNAAVPAEVTTDLAGNPRFADVPSVPDTGSGAPPIVDMGAYEMPALGVLYVDADADPGGNGLSWTDAFTEVQNALSVAQPGHEVWVAEGVYTPDYDPGLGSYTGWVTATFALTDGVALYGGFDPGGGVTIWDQRDPAAYVTALSGDLDRNDTADLNGVVTTTENITGTNAWTVVTASGVDGTAGLDGFTVTAGNAHGTDCVSDQPCRSGGGMHNYASSPTLVDVTFSGNSAAWGGGGMFNYDQSSPTLEDVTFSGNSSQWSGGGMSNKVGSNPTLVDVTFSGNSAVTGFGAGLENYLDSNPILVDVTFSGNSAGYGGGMSNYHECNPELVNVTFSGNSATYGGGMENYENSSPTLVNVTFSGNSAGYYGGGMNTHSGSPTLANCILWGNAAATGDQIYGSAAVTYSDIEGGWTGMGNIDADPLFVDAAGGDLRPRPGSPAIDAGNNAAVPEGVTTDLAGWARFIDVPSVADTGSGTAPIVDMGAYETPLTVYLPLVLRAAP